MKILDVKSLPLQGVKVIRFARFRDSRGYFAEQMRASDISSHLGESCSKFVQANESFSNENVMRGLHFQWNPYMGKLVRTLSGRMIDIVLDIRVNSSTAGKAIAYDMPAPIADSNYDEWIWVPPGFAHGNFFSKPTKIEYLCTGEYNATCEACISPVATDIDWSLCDPALRQIIDVPDRIISDKDKAGLMFKQWMSDDRSKNFNVELL